jgi:23S rRNA pseudouridine2605 synthase
MTETPPAEGERIAKYLASAGIASRRDVEKMIAEGRVFVDGQKLETPAFKVTGKEKILVDGQPVQRPEGTRLWRYHKPSGLVTTNRDPEGRATIFEDLPKWLPRVVTIGRLDLTTEGLLLLTNDGELARALELPATGLTRKYRARAYGRAQQKDLDRLRDGIVYEGEEYRSIIATVDRVTGANSWIDITLAEGKKREVRRALESLGLKVNRLIRVTYGPIELGDLEPGAVDEIEPSELLAHFAEMIPERRRPQPFRNERGNARSKQESSPARKPSAKPAPRPQPRRPDREEAPRKKTWGKANRSGQARPEFVPAAGEHSGKRHTGKPVRKKTPRPPSSGKPSSGKPESAGRGSGRPSSGKPPQRGPSPRRSTRGRDR